MLLLFCSCCIYLLCQCKGRCRNGVHLPSGTQTCVSVTSKALILGMAYLTRLKKIEPYLILMWLSQSILALGIICSIFTLEWHLQTSSCITLQAHKSSSKPRNSQLQKFQIFSIVLTTSRVCFFPRLCFYFVFGCILTVELLASSSFSISNFFTVLGISL